MSLVLLATTNCSIGAPIRWAIHPDSTLPKLPVGTQNVSGVASDRQAAT